MTDDMKPVRCGCGGETVIMPTPSGRFAVGCKKCDICTGLYNTEAEAVKAWNTAMGERTAKAIRNPQAFFYRCECGYGLCCEKNDMNYCPMCGARLEWE